MAVEILMPKLGLTMKTGTIVKWLKEEGETVRSKEPLLEIETEKLSHEIESPIDGILLKKLAVVGEKYPIAFIVGYVGQPGEEIPAAAGTVAAADTAADGKLPVRNAVLQEAPFAKRIFISPLARKLAGSLGLDYKKIKGTGPNGRIVKADVLRFSEEQRTDVAAIESAEDDTVIPYSGIRRAIGENMLQAWTTIPMVTHHVMADVGALLEYRAMLNNGAVERSEHVSINDLILKLTAVALEKTPAVNAALTDDGIVRYKRVHLGMATALDNGLVVPVIRDANRKNLLVLSKEAKDLAARARSGSLSPDALHGATFTVSNLGGYGSVDLFTPIINPPEAGILGIGRITDTAVPVNGEITIRPLIGLSFTYDHRIIDGAVAAEFIRTLIQLLENPARAVLL